MMRSSGSLMSDPGGKQGNPCARSFGIRFAPTIQQYPHRIGRPAMSEDKRDHTKVDPITGGEEPQPAQPLQTVPPGQPANATTATIPGTGEKIEDVRGQEAKRVVRT